MYEEERDFVLNLILVNLERQVGSDDSSRLEQMESEKLVEKLVGNGERVSIMDIFRYMYTTQKVTLYLYPFCLRWVLAIFIDIDR